MAPNLAALLSLALGIMLLTSGATPSSPARFVQLLAIAPSFLIETSHFVSSVLGLVMVLLAMGLRQRLDSAWTTALVSPWPPPSWPSSRASTGSSRWPWSPSAA